MKVQNSSDSITAFAGLNFISHDINSCGILQLIDNELGIKSPLATYGLSDCIKALWLTFIAGGDCAEDMNEHLKDTLLSIPDLKVPNADTVLRDLKGLATPTCIEVTAKKVTHQQNLNPKLNALLIKSLIKLKLLSTNQKHDFDYDNQVIPTEKYDAARTYKQVDGYQPGVATIGNHIVYIENRNGNSPARYQQAQTLENAYQTLQKQGINIKRSRMDCASYQKEVIEVVTKYSDLFYIRAQRCDAMAAQIKQVEHWQTQRIGFKDYQVASIQYQPFGEEKSYRVVISREPQQEGNLFTADHFSYRGIITSDNQSTDVEVLQYYNQRGAQEKIFDQMNNDFGWSKMPFSFLNENTVFLTIMAICRSLYLYLLEKYSSKVSFLSVNFRLKKFRFRFIQVAGKWIKRGRQYILKLFTDKDYSRVCRE
jgi:hypothetical protein